MNCKYMKSPITTVFRWQFQRASAECGWPVLVAIRTQNGHRNTKSEKFYYSFEWARGSFLSYPSSWLFLILEIKSCGATGAMTETQALYLSNRWAWLSSDRLFLGDRDPFLYFSVSNWQNSIVRHPNLDLERLWLSITLLAFCCFCAQQTVPAAVSQWNTSVKVSLLPAFLFNQIQSSRWSWPADFHQVKCLVTKGLLIFL